jgi:NAD(P)-dependent dehydrogenase (short-subunit alcohol dehydrogenase family)
MDLQLTGKTAFISGSTQGIGFAIADAFTAEGVDVVVNGRDATRVEQAVERLRTAHPASAPRGISADFTDAGAVEQLLSVVGDVDILVNNVGLFGLAEFDEVTDEDWKLYFEVNVMSAVRLTRRLLGPMLDRGWGRVISVGSESGVNVPVDMVHYGVTKAALLALTNGLAKSTRGTAVTINTVLGGPTYSEGVATAVEAVAAARSVPAETMRDAVIGQNRTTLLERFLAPHEIADVVLWLASPRSSATNGAAVRADGGVLTAML